VLQQDDWIEEIWQGRAITGCRAQLRAFGAASKALGDAATTPPLSRLIQNGGFSFIAPFIGRRRPLDLPTEHPLTTLISGRFSCWWLWFLSLGREFATGRMTIADKPPWLCFNLKKPGRDKISAQYFHRWFDG